MCSRFISLVTTACLFAGTPAYGNGISDKISVSGFIGLGYATTSDNNFLGDQEDNAELFEGGVRVNVQLLDNLEFNGQVVHRRLGQNFTEGGLRVDFASLDWRSQLFSHGEQSISLGRFKTPSGIYNTTRDVPFTRPSILLAQSVYLDIFRDFLLNTDGVRFASVHPISEGILTIDAGIGQADFGGTWNRLALGEGANGSWEYDFGDAFYLDLRYSSQNWLLSATYHDVVTDFDAAPNQFIPGPLPGLQIPLIDGGFDVGSWVLGAQYIRNDWELTAEYVYRDIEFNGFAPGTSTTERPIEGYYGQLRYYLTPEIVAMARWDRFYRNADDKDGQEFTQLGLPGWLASTTSRTLGINWQLSSKWTLAAEVHWNSGAGWLPPFSTVDIRSATDRKWSLGLAQLSYRF